MSALSDELHSVLTAFRQHVGTWTNQGLTVSIDGHLRQIEAAAADVTRSAEDEVHRILADLYSAFHTPATETPAEPAPAPAAPAAADVPAQPLATGGLVSGPGPVLVGESGPEFLLPQGAPVAAPAPAPVPPAPAAEAAAEAAAETPEASA